MLITKQWLMLMKRYINKFRKLAILAMAAQVYVDLHVTDWVTTQNKDLILKTMIKWISHWKVQDLRHLLGKKTGTKEGKTILREWKKLMLYQGALYHDHMPTGKLEEALQFVVHKAHWLAAMNGCHYDAGHQGQQWTLCLLLVWFWWPGMAVQMQKVISSCEQCIQHEGICAKAPMWPRVAACWLHQHWDHDGVGSTPKHSEPVGLLWPLYETCYGIRDP